MKSVVMALAGMMAMATVADAGWVTVRHRSCSWGCGTRTRTVIRTRGYHCHPVCKPCQPVCKPCKPCPPKCDKPKCKKPKDSICPKCPGECEEGKACPPKKTVVVGQAEACLVIVNQHRARAGLGLLRLSPRLCGLCDSHCHVQASRRSMFHSSYGMRENVAMGPRSAHSVMNMWMNSSGHRANILSHCTEIGVGECNGYWTMILR